MKYITGMHALNLPCSINTCGDWHASSIHWDVSTVFFKESEDSIFKDYGIEKDKNVHRLDGIFNVANHIRACLDYLEDGEFSLIKQMRNDFICDDSYMLEIFNEVILLKDLPHWPLVDKFIGLEYYRNWLDFKKSINFIHKNEDYLTALFFNYLKTKENDLVLKGSSALRYCYSSLRPVDYLNFDAENSNLIDLANDFCKIHSLLLIVDKNTTDEKRCTLHMKNMDEYLEMRASYRHKNISSSKILEKNGIRTYNIDTLFSRKVSDFCGRNLLRDIYDVCFIFKNYYEQLTPNSLSTLQIVLPYKAFDYVDYLIENQPYEKSNRGINFDFDAKILAQDFMDMFDKLGVLVSTEEKELAEKYYNLNIKTRLT
jgi:hypothetical protein